MKILMMVFLYYIRMILQIWKFFGIGLITGERWINGEINKLTDIITDAREKSFEELYSEVKNS